MDKTRIGCIACLTIAILVGESKANPACIPTEADAMGPFFVANTPITDSLNRFGKVGEPLVIEGMIRSAGTGNPGLANARIEIWQTDGGGNYYPASNGDYSDYDDSDIDMRGTVITAEDGSFAVKSVIPGAYLPRPRHFHYRISANGHKTLVTQHYVTGDGVFRQPGGECRHAPIQARAEGSFYRAPDIFLEPN